MLLLRKFFLWLGGLAFYLRVRFLPSPAKFPLLTNPGKRYLAAGKRFAERVSQVSVYSQLDVDKVLIEWETSEQEYAECGYRTLPLSAFIEHVSWGVPIHGAYEKREEGEPPMLHARYYRYFSLRKKGLHELVKLIEGEEKQYHS